MANYIEIRVLQHDTEDQIRIGESVPVAEDKLQAYSERVIDEYQKRLEWCGGFDNGCRTYYKRICLVDAESLAVIKTIYPKQEEA